MRRRLPIIFAWGAAMSANVLNWLYNIYLNRVLTLAEFSQISALLNGLLLISTLALAFQYAFSGLWPLVERRLPGKISLPFTNLTLVTVSVGVLLWILALLSQTWWTNFLHLTLPYPILTLFGSCLLWLFIAGFAKGYLYGRRLYYLVGFFLISESLIKLAFTFLGPRFRLTLFSGGVLSIPLSMFLPYSLILIYAVFKHKLKFHISLNWVGRYTRLVLLTFLTGVGVQLLFMTDVLMVKHFFSADLAGVYATLSLIGKMIFFFVTSIVALMAPEVTARQADRTGSRRLLWLSVGFALLTGCGFSLAFGFFPQYTLNLFLDPVKVNLAHPFVLQYGLTVTLIGLLVVVSTYFVFIGYKWLVAATVIGLCLQIYLMAFYHPDLKAIVNIMSLVALFACPLMGLLILGERHFRRSILLNSQK